MRRTQSGRRIPPPANVMLVPRGVTKWYHECMADHYTLRLAPGVRQRLSEWARRAGIQERTLAQRYVEEGLRHDANAGNDRGDHGLAGGWDVHDIGRGPVP